MLKYLLKRELKKDRYIYGENIIELINSNTSSTLINITNKELWFEFFINPNCLVKFRAIKNESRFGWWLLMDFMSEYDITVEDYGSTGTIEYMCNSLQDKYLEGKRRYGKGSTHDDFYKLKKKG